MRRVPPRRRAGLVACVLAAALVAAGCSSPPRHRVDPATRAGAGTSGAATAVGPDGVTARWVQAENRRPGTTAWEIQGQQAAGSIEGYASAVSAEPGDTVTLFVSTVAPTFHVEAYRIGWYQGLGGRLVWTSPEVPGSVQPTPAPDPVTNMVECDWAPSLPVPVGTDWPTGDYLLKLVGGGGQQRWVPLTVRDDTGHSAYLIQNSVTTWEAYNTWGGYDLYQGISSSAGATDYQHRSRVVSFDRPYAFGSGAADFYGNEYPFVRLAERLGLDVSYTTNVDVDLHPELVANHSMFISLGHDEYWSTVMRDALVTAQAGGVNLAFLGANAIYRHIRFDSSPNGPDRRVICYKSVSEDPLSGVDDPEVTTNWPDPPVPRPASTIIGDTYRCNPVTDPMVFVDGGSWLLAGTGLGDGSALSNVVGSEYDRYVPGPASPADVEIVAHSPVTCGGEADDSDLTYYTAPGGGGVFASGTNLWVASLGGECAQPCEVPQVTAVTENLLAGFGHGPAGRLHPSQPNWSRFYPAGASAPPIAGGT